MKSVAFIKLTALVSLLIIGLVIGCTDPPTKPDIDDEIDPPNIIVSVFPDIGTNLTEFQPSLRIVTDSDSVIIGDGYQVRCDYDNDGIPDTDWLDTIPPTSTFDQYGPHELVFEVRDTIEVIDTSSCVIHVQELIQITPINSGGFSQSNLDWAKDGSNRLAFDWHAGDNWAYQSIFTVQYPGGAPERVSFHPDSTTYHFDQYPEWSPDGSKIACHSSLGLCMIDLASSEREIIDSLGWTITLDWSPDGNKLVYVRDGALVVNNLIDGTIDTIFDATPYSVGWSPDGETFATLQYLTAPDGIFRIHDAHSFEVRKEILVHTRGYKIEYSPNGKWISTSFHSNTATLYNSESMKTMSIKVDGLKGSHSFTWNHDGSMIGFSAWPEGVDGTHASIWAIEFPNTYF